MPILVVTINPREGKTEEVAEALASIASQVHEGLGYKLYALHRSGDNVVLIEKWIDDQPFVAHRAAPSLSRLRELIDDLTAASWDVRFLSPLPLGSLVKGVL
ncbi:MAG TPA: antibiotic biosynthesis monooxygenase [Acidimicrobiales bacterium]|nr:antibiotic biosynthesis monooxygenase [Acidimicrobiales bacterium]